MPASAPNEPREARSAVHAIATIGNAVFLAFLAIVLSQDRLFTAQVPAASEGRSASIAAVDNRNSRVLLVVIDGLRADSAADPRLMPTLATLAQRGTFSTARVESLIPSTVSGVIALTTGVTPPAACTLQDFRALPSGGGGLFEQVRLSGGRSFVAGPAIWFDLYGRWIDGGGAHHSLVHSDDRPSVESTVRALKSDQFRLMVLHLGAPDDAAHVHGTRSAAYEAAVRQADDVVRRVLPLLRADDVIVVTADHGNTVAGGHAGAEDDVVNVPVVVASLDHRGARGQHVVRQADIPAKIAGCLGLPWRSPPTAPARGPAKPIVIAVVCLVAVLWTIGGVRAAPRDRLTATTLHTAIWISLALAVMVGRDAAIATILAVLTLVAARHRRITSRAPLVLACVAGTMLATFRLADGTGPTWSSAEARDASFIVAVIASYVTGRCLGAWMRTHPNRAMACGGVAAVCATFASRIAGQTPSLSTLDVRWAYSLATSEISIPVAVIVVAFVHAAPVLATFAGLRRALKQASGETLVCFASGAGGVFLGQSFILSIALCTTPQLAALAIGGLLRVAAECISSFLPLAGASLAGRSSTGWLTGRGCTCWEGDAAPSEPALQ